MNEQFWWYVARSSGMVAAVLLVLTMIWGIALSSKLIDRRGLPAWLTDLHRYLGGATVVFIGVHLASLVADSYLTFSWSDLFVPFASSWKAGPVAWGVGAFWGLVVVEGTSLAQRRMKRTVWRRLHLLSYPAALMTAVHAAQAGTDAGNPVYRTASIGLVLVLTALTLFRVLYRRPGRRDRSATAVRPAQASARRAAEARPSEGGAPDEVTARGPAVGTGAASNGNGELR